jgi:hypothetical protein
MRKLEIGSIFSTASFAPGAFENGAHRNVCPPCGRGFGVDVRGGHRSGSSARRHLCSACRDASERNALMCLELFLQSDAALAGLKVLSVVAVRIAACLRGAGDEVVFAVP